MERREWVSTPPRIGVRRLARHQGQTPASFRFHRISRAITGANLACGDADCKFRISILNSQLQTSSGSPITFSGFNSIDFNVVLNAIMQQESQPLQALQDRQSALQATDSSYGQLATKLDALRTASGALSDSTTLTSYAATSSDSTALTVSASSGATAGRYEVVVNELARAQVTVSSTFAPDTDTTVVATGGSLTIGSEQINISGPVTLQQLSAAINADANAPASASIVATEPGEYRLVLTSKDTGAANAFTITNQLTAGTMTFADANNDNISGNSASDNAVNATDASVLINNIAVTSSSNTLDSGIPGVSLTLLQKDPTNTVVVSVSPRR